MRSSRLPQSPLFTKDCLLHTNPPLGLRSLKALEIGGKRVPEETVGLFEVGADGVDLVDEVLDAVNAEFSKLLLDDGVVGEGNALAVDFGESSLVNQLPDGGEGGVSVGDVGLDFSEHGEGGLVDADECRVVELAQLEEAESGPDVGVEVVDTKAL